MGGLNFHQLDPLEFEMMVTSLMVKLGYEDVINRQGSNDGGIDVEATSKSVVSENKIAIQCKRYADNKVRLQHIRSLDSAVRNENFTTGIIITSGEFTPDAIDYAMKASVKIQLIDGEHLEALIHRAFPTITSIRDILELDLATNQPQYSQDKKAQIPENNSLQEEIAEVRKTKDPLGMDQPYHSKKIAIANQVEPGSYIYVDGFKVRVVNQRQITNIKLPKLDQKCPNCGMNLRGDAQYCVKDDWFFGNEKFDPRTKQKKEYCTHHPQTELKGTDKYCHKCDWNYI